MKGEIKIRTIEQQALDDLKALANAKEDEEVYIEYGLNTKARILLDYITNLQEENERLKNGYCELKVKCNNGECDCTNEEYDEMVESNIKLCNDLDDYKSRNEKAIEYIINNCILSDEWKDLDFCNFIPTGRIEYKQLSKAKIKYLLNILKGDKDE